MDLVVQGPALAASDVAAIADLAGAQGIHALAGREPAYRLSRVGSQQGVAEHCAAARIDHAFVPTELTRQRVRVVAMDMDSTLITIECIDEIADRVGIKREVAEITAAAMRGEIDFAQSLTRRVALLAGLPVVELARVYDERLGLSPGAEVMLNGFKAAGAKTLLVSGGFTFFTERLKQRLGLDYIISNRLEIKDGRLTGRLLGEIVDAAAKAAKFRAVMRGLGARKQQTVAIGDGANDLKMMAEAGLSIAFHAKPVVRAMADCALTYCGLDGVVNLFEP